MTLSPTPAEHLARARADLRLGLPVVLEDGEGRVLAAAAETLDAARLAAICGARAAGPGDDRAPRRDAEGARL